LPVRDRATDASGDPGGRGMGTHLEVSLSYVRNPACSISDIAIGCPRTSSITSIQSVCSLIMRVA
jgi:hypothetical protein